MGIEAANAQAVPLSRAARVQAGITRAQEYAESGRFSEAATHYAAVLPDAGMLGGALHASALFGYASAVQQAAELPDSAAVAPQVNAELVADYQKAAGLDSNRYFGAANNNAGLLLLKGGRAREAAARFVAAAGTTHSARAYFWWNAGRAYAAASLPDSAAWAYRQSLAADSSYYESRRGLLDLDVKAHRADSVLAHAARWERHPGSADAVSDALLAVLIDRSEQPDSLVDSMLVVFARTLGITRPTPEFFAATFAGRLDSAAWVRPSLQPGIVALRDAYTPNRKQFYREPESAVKWWWRWSGSTKQATGSRRGIWSTTLRTIGDYYRDAASPRMAASYYEAAIGFPDRVGQPWTDPDALLPLAVIYLGRSSQDFDIFMDLVFMGKGEAYAAHDYPRVRYFHMALGQLFAEQRQWGDMYKPRSAIFQLERMRRATAAVVRESGDSIYDPPNLLELLAQGYKETGNPSMARTTALAAKQGFQRLGRAADAERIDRKYLQTSAPP